MTDDCETLTIAQAAVRTGISAGLLRGAIKRGELPTFAVPGCGWARVRAVDLAAWVAGHAERAARKAS